VRLTRATIPQWIWPLAGVALGIYLVYLLQDVLTPIFFAFLVAYMLDPVVDRLEAWRIPRALAIVLLLSVVLGVVVLFVVLVIPGVVRDVAAFVTDLPEQIAKLWVKVEPWLTANGVQVPHSWQEAVTQTRVDFRAIAEKALAPAGEILKTIVGTTASAIGTIVALLLIPVFAFYLLYDFDRMRFAVRDLVPWRYRALVIEIFEEIDATIGQWIRGQLIVMCILGALYAISFAVLGVRLAVPIGIFAGLLSFIPYVGSGSALTLGSLMCIIDWSEGGLARLAGVIVAYAVIQVLDGLFITPRIVGEKVGLQAIWVLIALLVGSELFGFLGVLIAVPAAAIIKILVRRVIAYYRKSELFRQGAPEHSLAAAGGELGEIPDLVAAAAPPPSATDALDEPALRPERGAADASTRPDEAPSARDAGAGAGTGDADEPEKEHE